MTVRVDHGVTSGTFSLDGETFDVDNNVWVVGDDQECLVVDAPHDVEGDGQTVTVAGTTLQVLHTPGHAPGGVCLYAPDLGCVFTGDTLFHGGPGATAPLRVLDAIDQSPGPSPTRLA